MGRSITPKYRIDEKNRLGNWYPFAAWDVKSNGKVTKASLENYRVALNASYQAGGVNAHIGKAVGYIPHHASLRLVEQKTGRVVCETHMPMFEVA
jgi:hypothetical protein